MTRRRKVRSESATAKRRFFPRSRVHEVAFHRMMQYDKHTTVRDGHMCRDGSITGNNMHRGYLVNDALCFHAEQGGLLLIFTMDIYVHNFYHSNGNYEMLSHFIL